MVMQLKERKNYACFYIPQETYRGDDVCVTVAAQCDVVALAMSATSVGSDKLH